MLLNSIGQKRMALLLIFVTVDPVRNRPARHGYGRLGATYF